MSRTQIVLTALLLSFVSSALAAERIDLNGHWQFRTDPAREGSAQVWFRRLPANLETVDVPHTWNIGKYEDYEGTAWYFRSFLLPAGAQGKHVELHFGATFYRARVWVNGVEAGEHEGGHTAWFLDITALVKPVNTVALEIDNLPGIATIPGYAMDMGHVNVWYDWWHYGGIVRDVWLTVNQPLLLRRQHVRSKISADSADVTDDVVLENFSKRAANVTVRLTLYAPSGEPVAKTERVLHAAVGENTVQFAFHADHLKLWSLDQPEVYRVEATLADRAGTPIDSLEDNYGFRTIELRDGRLYVNGERVRLSGMTRHEESPWEGLAETRGTMLHDYAEMKQLQVTLTRPVHYPQHPFILDFSDRNGILLIPEIPLWHFSEQQLTDPNVIALAKQMMVEMIEQNWNHPSIFGWSVCNESATNTPGGRRYFQTMYDWVKQLDPERYVSYADDHFLFGPDPKINAASLADFVMMNEYAGTWHSDPENLEPALSRIGREYPGKMVIISEFGAASLFAKDRIEGDALRRKIIAEHLDVFRKFDFIGGAILWCYQDYRSHRNLRPGETAGLVEMGVVDENRQRYPSFDLWRKENSPAAVKLTFQYPQLRHTPAGFKARIARTPENWLPSYPLHSYKAVWVVRDQARNLIVSGEKALPEIGDEQQIDIPFDAPSATTLQLSFRLLRPTGYTAWEDTLDWSSGPSSGDTVNDMEKRGIRVP